MAIMIVSPARSEQPIATWLSVNGTGRIVEGGAPDLLTGLAASLTPGVDFVPDGAPPGFLTRIRIEKVGGVGRWTSYAAADPD